MAVSRELGGVVIPDTGDSDPGVAETVWLEHVVRRLRARQQEIERLTGAKDPEIARVLGIYASKV